MQQRLHAPEPQQRHICELTVDAVTAIAGAGSQDYPFILR
jgi:hypothetical protein